MYEVNDLEFDWLLVWQKPINSIIIESECRILPASVVSLIDDDHGPSFFLYLNSYVFDSFKLSTNTTSLVEFAFTVCTIFFVVAGLVELISISYSWLVDDFGNAISKVSEELDLVTLGSKHDK